LDKTRVELLNENQREKKFEQVLSQSIDEALSVLGESVKKSVYFHLEHKFMIARRDIPNNVNDFSDALELLFGMGAWHLETLIMMKLHEKVKCLYRWEGPKWLVPELTFRKYVELMRLGYEDERKIGELEVFVDAEKQCKQIRR
jgi:hypothetical protein